MTLFEVKVKRAWTAGSGVTLPGQHHSQSERRPLVNLCPNPLGRPAVPVCGTKHRNRLLVNRGVTQTCRCVAPNLEVEGNLSA